MLACWPPCMSATLLATSMSATLCKVLWTDGQIYGLTGVAARDNCASKKNKQPKLIPHFASGYYPHIYIAIKANPTVVSGRNTYAGSTFVLWLTRVQYGGRRTLGVPLMIIIYRIQNPNANQPMSNNVSFCHFDPAFLSNLYVSGQHGVKTLFSRAEYWTSLCWLFSRFVVKCPSSSVKLHHTTISTTAYGCDTISCWKGKPKKEF